MLQIKDTFPGGVSAGAVKHPHHQAGESLNQEKPSQEHPDGPSPAPWVRIVFWHEEKDELLHGSSHDLLPALPGFHDWLTNCF